MKTMTSGIAGREGRAGPRIWALLGHRAGDNLQVEALAGALAGALGWPWERKRLAWRRRAGWTPLYGRMRPSLAPLTEAARVDLAPAGTPDWPELVISAGWRSVPVARWIAARAGARLVHIGRPRAPLSAFDLVLTTPQYALPEAPNVVRLPGPLSRLSPGRLAAAAERWRGPLADLPRPWIAVLVGGDAPPLRLTAEAAAGLGARADALARARGGSLLIATGPRTGGAAAEALVARISVPAHRYLWGEDGENPYEGYLALADEFIVTGDSISMLHEASLTGRPLHLFELPTRGLPGAAALRRLHRRLGTGAGAAGRAYRHLIRAGWLYAPRDTRAVHAALIGSGRATRLGDPVPQPSRQAADDATDRAVAAVRALFAGES